jgi:TRAP-type C4-dicarboxylate transport system permease small subunit
MLARLRALGDGWSVALFAALFGVFIVQIGARFILDQPLPWTDELAVILYLWVVLWAAAASVREREHVRFDLIHDLMPAPLRRGVRMLGHLAIALLALLALPASWDYVSAMRQESSPVLGIPMFWVDLPFVLLLIGMVLRSGHALWLEARKVQP